MPKSALRKKKRNQLRLKDREWVGTSDMIPHTDVHKSGDNHVLSVSKRDSPNTHAHDHRFHLFPHWSMEFRERGTVHHFRKDLQDFLSLLHDTLLDSEPKIEIRYARHREGPNREGPNCKRPKPRGYVRKTGILQGFVGQKGDDEGVIKFNTQHNFHLNLKMAKNCHLPDELQDFSIRIVGKLLPRGRYKYGYCSKLNGRFMHCSDFAYLENHTSNNLFVNKKRCRPVDLTKGNPHQYCTVKEGT